MSIIRIGTCSWKYESWKDLVYTSAKSENFLLEYAKKYQTVEIDQWFWSLHGLNKITLPQKSVVEEYLNSVPDNFKFTIKIPNSITLTHLYQKDKSGTLIRNPYFLNIDLFNEFLDAIKPLKQNTGILVFQFEYLNKLKMSGQQEFLICLEKFFKNINAEFEYGIEIRNPNYLNKTYFEFLRRHNLRMVFLQGYYMPNIWEVFNNYKELLEKLVVIRLHGEDRKGIEEKSGENWSKIISPKDSEIDKIIEMIKYLRLKEINTYINVNNHYEGSAPLTIEKFREIIE
ncbi:MAG: DUF72 domain-containing protein [bacterium]